MSAAECKHVQQVAFACWQSGQNHEQHQGSGLKRKRAPEDNSPDAGKSA